jgi:hypothetical protein
MAEVTASAATYKELERAYLEACFPSPTCMPPPLVLAAGRVLNRALGRCVYDPQGVYQVRRGEVTRLD